MMNRTLIRKIEEATGLSYCDSYCPCGENDHMLWWNSCVDYPAWLPEWTNGVSPQKMYEWLMKQSATSQEIHTAMRNAHMRVCTLESK